MSIDAIRARQYICPYMPYDYDTSQAIHMSIGDIRSSIQAIHMSIDATRARQYICLLMTNEPGNTYVHNAIRARQYICP